MGGAGFVGPVLGTAAGVAGIGIAAMGAGMIAGEVNQIIPRAKKTLEKEKG